MKQNYYNVKQETVAHRIIIIIKQIHGLSVWGVSWSQGGYGCTTVFNIRNHVYKCTARSMFECVSMRGRYLMQIDIYVLLYNKYKGISQPRHAVLPG